MDFLRGYNFANLAKILFLKRTGSSKSITAIVSMKKNLNKGSIYFKMITINFLAVEKDHG